VHLGDPAIRARVTMVAETTKHCQLAGSAARGHLGAAEI
jgi:hypothetical protein